MDGLQFEDFELEGGAPSQDGERDPSIDFSIKVTLSDILTRHKFFLVQFILFISHFNKILFPRYLLN